MTRIIAGAHGGRRLAAPPGAQTRPTSDRVREALFSALGTMIDLDGARFADLYAGSGAVGLEALSRGATFVLLVEADARAARVIRDNIAALRAGDAARLVTGKVGPGAGRAAGGRAVRRGLRRSAVRGARRRADRDAAGAGGQRLAGAGRGGGGRAVHPTAVRGEPLSWVDGITAERSRRYGETTLWYGRRS